MYKDINDPRNRESKRKHYYKNKQAYKDRANRRKEELRQYLRKMKEAGSCADCEKKYPYYVMEYDHLDSEKKTRCVSISVNYGSFKTLQKEIDKCELVCSNCHKERTHQRRIGGVG
jgi:hypothetical protein